MPPRARWAPVVAALGALVPSGPPVRAHGVAPSASDPLGLLTAWTFDPLPWAGAAIAVVAYLAAVRRVDARHPRSVVPRRRIAAWLLGLAVLLIALASPIDRYAEALFSVHMVQHLLITMVAAPLLALGAPVTLLLRVASPEVRRGWILPLLHSPALRVLSFPPLAWVLFAAVMWASHFSPLFDAALEDRAVHSLEHALFLGAGLLFWWPAVGADPAPWRLAPAARIGYLLLGMPQNAFLGLAIVSAPDVLYRHYAEVSRGFGPTALADQQLAGGIMWAGGDLLFLVPLLLAIAAWFRDEERKGERYDEGLARRRAVEARRLTR